MQKVLLIGLVLGLLSLCQIGMAEAYLIEQDLVSGSGDKFITYSEKSELSWLDLTLTTGQSYNEVINRSYIDAGFRYAKAFEVHQLFLEMGFQLETR
ncbi:MAG: hypothetical protein H7X83_10100 [Verrucomicrobia bacterium]|nr:hypothetical protein [Deltaproteobacteria bacterium]